MLQFIVTLQALITDRLERLENDKGATAVEYGLMVALIAVAIIGAVTAVGVDLIELFGRIGTALDAA